VSERTLAPVGRRLVRVIEHQRVGAYTVLGCADPDGPAPDPGQFYMLAAAEGWGGGEDERPFLPRAFSVMRSRADGTREFVLEDVGPGTRRLAELRPGDGMWLLGPLGRGFEPPREARRPVLVGGGVGIAPLAIWRDALGALPGPDPWDQEPPLVLLGFRDGEHAIGAGLIPGARVATDDGSVGHHGFVTELLAGELGGVIEVYACGPPPMLEAVRAMCAERGVPAQLALESGMACGFGACFGCVVATRDGYVRLCVDGPVLRADTIDAVPEVATAEVGGAA
jgi:dihydroorotate dehydrogenase electron transfer subunit